MARPGWPERNKAARSFRQLRRFHHVINSDKVFGTHRADVSRERRPFPRSMMRGRLRGNPTLRSLTKVGPGESAIEALDFVDQDGGRYVLGTAPAFRCDDEICLLGVDF